MEDFTESESFDFESLKTEEKRPRLCFFESELSISSSFINTKSRCDEANMPIALEKYLINKNFILTLNSISKQI
jgi:hypothetical protein